ncbi:hypothetical protein EVAR_59705_1 [Eumeta japonica]|uniref:Uncharacterized protein n=1 Tax=Eumeta variegata TaxID=151549 RepID=A0A4C1XGX3_EUMVA|nr:hypothetical protein EVAR_59705_1 [Eumeta japonica]
MIADRIDARYLTMVQYERVYVYCTEIIPRMAAAVIGTIRRIKHISWRETRVTEITLEMRHRQLFSTLKLPPIPNADSPRKEWTRNPRNTCKANIIDLETFLLDRIPKPGSLTVKANLLTALLPALLFYSINTFYCPNIRKSQHKVYTAEAYPVSATAQRMIRSTHETGTMRG